MLILSFNSEHHEAILELKNKIENGPKDKIYDIDLTYITSRGNWYHNSWKGDIDKSGGIASNIGVHFFDMLQWIFGPMKSYTVDIMVKTVWKIEVLIRQI